MSGSVADSSATNFSVLGTTTTDVETDINAFIDSLVVNDPYSFWTNVFAGTQGHRVALSVRFEFHVNDGAGTDKVFYFNFAAVENFSGETDLSKLKNMLGGFIGGIEAVFVWSTFDTIDIIKGRGHLFVEYLP